MSALPVVQWVGLAFFLASVDREADLANRIVVFDDPFSSHDAFRRTHPIYEILRIGAACKQVIVLSHDVQFLKQLWGKDSAQQSGRLADNLLSRKRVKDSGTRPRASKSRKNRCRAG
jgi:wobble nucleotide-excising tRNase